MLFSKIQNFHLANRPSGLAGSDLISSATNISQVVDAEEGTYYLLLECRQTLDNLGLTLTLGDTDYLRWGTPSVKLYVWGNYNKFKILSFLAEGWRS